ncbi:hypothetical protein XA68_11110 [Ophiocordyceps unilateralis]|uniref:DUF7624 domain-containing protein n=1 Tax=Ophiocordyceps unilateralis TaxID=268505 RepID=A0A2A9PHG9_OPHUN|nr:hypothetical protein XA68_11110 [Ophiocordyceps unilateralis]
MALEAPLSSTGQHFALLREPNMSASADADGLRSPLRPVSSPPFASLRPPSAYRASTSAMNLLSPSDIVGPSPVTSNGTETTEIEDDVSEEVHQAHMTEVEASRGSGLLFSTPPALEPALSDRRASQLPVLSTNLPDTVRQSSSEDAVSVIHAPENLSSWSLAKPVSEAVQSTHSSPEVGAHDSAVAKETPQKSSPTLSRPPISTDVKPVRYSIDSATPRAQDLQDMLTDSNRLRSSSSSSLDKIDEQTEAEVDDDEDEDDDDDDDDDEVYTRKPLAGLETEGTQGLRSALQDCWTLTNTLANLSSKHRNQIFINSETPDAHEKAWRTCWKLCKRLYHDQGDGGESRKARTNLDLCRDFCQALFDVRQRRDETGDSVLRVSFELNNHLYSAQDSQSLPEQFRERTLDFYITLCHRLMKQRSELAKETNKLLRACWGLAEMLFSLRQSRRDGRSPDEELLGSAVQACWELCDIFRDGWAQIRPERDTPRPSQASFFPQQQPMDQTGRESRQSSRSSIFSRRDSVKSGLQEDRPRKPPPVPETPITEFEDTPVSPESRSPQLPNIMVLGTTSDGSRGGRWSSNASNMSSYSRSSNRTSSTAKTTAVGGGSDLNVARAKILVLRAAMNLGFDRDSNVDGKEPSGVTLQNFVQGLRASSLGSLPSQATLLQQYQKSIVVDALIPRGQALPSRGERVTALDMAKSVQALGNGSPRFAYLRDLFQLVFQFPMEEVESRRNVVITV